MDVSGAVSKVQCCIEQYCTGTWNVRSMNQGKLDVVKQEMARVNINILGICELKWMGMENLIQMTIIWQEYWSGLPFPPLVDRILSELFTLTCLGWPCTMWLRASLGYASPVAMTRL